MTAIEIPAAMLAQIYAHARRAYPAECCGYLRDNEVVECRNAQLDGDHPTTPERGEDTGYVIAGAELLAFAKSFDSSRPALIVYHSHTMTEAYPSRTDVRWSETAGFPYWLLVSTRADEDEVRAFTITDGVVNEVQLRIT